MLEETEESKPETPVKAKERARVSDAEQHTYVENKDTTQNNLKWKKLFCAITVCHLTQAVRKKNVWLIICHLFTLNSSRLDSRKEQQKNKWRKFTPTWDARQEQKLQRIQFKEKKAPRAVWQTELTCPQKTAGSIDICLNCSAESLGGHLRLWYCLSLVMWLSAWWGKKRHWGKWRAVDGRQGLGWRVGWEGMREGQVNKEKWKRGELGESRRRLKNDEWRRGGRGAKECEWIVVKRRVRGGIVNQWERTYEVKRGSNSVQLFQWWAFGGAYVDWYFSDMVLFCSKNIFPGESAVWVNAPRYCLRGDFSVRMGKNASNFLSPPL